MQVNENLDIGLLPTLVLTDVSSWESASPKSIVEEIVADRNRIVYVEVIQESGIRMRHNNPDTQV
jgi:hypothetical protein